MSLSHHPRVITTTTSLRALSASSLVVAFLFLQDAAGDIAVAVSLVVDRCTSPGAVPAVVGSHCYVVTAA